MKFPNNTLKINDFEDKTLLIVDDDDPFRGRLGRAMTSKGFEVTLAKGVEEAKLMAKKKQILFTCKDIKPNVIKIGMLHSSKVIKFVAEALKKIKTTKIILDPVMIAKGGAKLINK